MFKPEPDIAVEALVRANLFEVSRRIAGSQLIPIFCTFMAIFVVSPRAVHRYTLAKAPLCRGC